MLTRCLIRIRFNEGKSKKITDSSGEIGYNIMLKDLLDHEQLSKNTQNFGTIRKYFLRVKLIDQSFMGWKEADRIDRTVGASIGVTDSVSF